MRRTAAAILLALATIGVSACGGGGKSSTSASSSSSSTTKTTTTTKTKHGKRFTLAETVRVSKSTAPAGSSATVSPGGAVAFHTRAPGTAAGKPVTVKIAITRQSPSKWTATATAKGKKASATLTGTGGKPITLTKLHYSCALPPTPSFCPVHHVSSSGKSTTMEFSTTPTTPITVAALVGPIPGASTAQAPGTLAVPPYTVTALVQSHPQNASSASKPATTVSAKRGDEVIIKTKLTGAKGGAPQKVTVGFDQGPGKTLHVSASVPGGHPSTATITSGSGSPITLVLPRYTCYLAPTPTFCPRSKLTAGSHHYTVTFPGSPSTPPAIAALVS